MNDLHTRLQLEEDEEAREGIVVTLAAACLAVGLALLIAIGWQLI